MNTANPSEMDEYRSTAARALSLCAGHDPWFPQPNRATVEAWAGQIAMYQLAVDDVLDGVRLAYRDNGSGFRPLPRDIVQAARQIRSERTQRESAADREAREDRQDAALEANRRRLNQLISGGPTGPAFGKSVDDA